MKFISKLFTHAMHWQMSRLDELYQRHAGQECYVFGDGVSVKWMDLHQFADRSSIIGNMIIYHQEVDALNIPYCTITEPYWFWPIYPNIGTDRGITYHSAHKEYRKSIIQNPETLFFINNSNYPFVRYSNVLFTSRWYKPPFKDKNPFRERLDSHMGTFSFQLSLAIYLGFKKAYLVGHDYTHFPSRSSHFYAKGNGHHQSRIRKFSHEFINYAKQHIDLTNVTLDAGSETMNYITYKELTGKEPSFRENIEIIDRVKLKSLELDSRDIPIF
jgi:hypothetical protein